MNKQLFRAKLSTFALVVAGLAGVAGLYAFEEHYSPGTASPDAVASELPTTPASAGLPNPVMSLPDFTQITGKYGPAVVNISVSGTEKAILQSTPGEDESPLENDPLFRFFRNFPGQGHGFGLIPHGTVPTHGEGSGFIVSSDGLILTNAHVVQDAKDVVVKLTDRREFHAKVLGSDPKTDIAVIKIAANHLPTVVFGSSANLKVGEWVLAIGSPFGFENSVTAGIVSAKGRSLPDDAYVPFIQTDAAVNPGNSGGPLLNTRGQVVGINSQIFSRSGGYQGLSFAIPIDVAEHVEEQILRTGHATHARLGVTVQEVNQTLADSFKMTEPEGALVSDVEKGSPAEHAGLQVGDIILQVNGTPIVTSIDLPNVIGESLPGQKVTINIWRDGKPRNVIAQLGNASASEAVASDNSPGAEHGKLGLALRQLQPDERRESGLHSGLVVEDASGAAARAGIQPGDVILSVNGTRVREVDQVRDLVAKAGKSVALLIQRGDTRIFVPVPLG
ncbi:MAG: DegQ family serine endoprotease [Thiobacillaceae bacterium]